MFHGNKRFKSATLCKDGTVEWDGAQVGLWWKDDFAGYRFSPFDEVRAKVSALTKSEFRSAVSANFNDSRS